MHLWSNHNLASFGQPHFGRKFQHLAMYSVFIRVSTGVQGKETMFASNAAEFLAISTQCPGQSSKHKHARWGLNRHTNIFATSDEAAYPMGLARLTAVVLQEFF